MKNNILILLLLFIASISYGQRAITQQIIGPPTLQFVTEQGNVTTLGAFFGDTVSGSDPIVNQNFVTKAYGDANYSGGGLWQDLTGAIAPTTISDEVRIGSVSDLGAGQLQVTGAVHGIITTGTSRGVSSSGTGTTGVGVFGASTGTSGVGVSGLTTAVTGATWGGSFTSNASSDGIAILLNGGKSAIQTAFNTAPSSTSDTGTAGEIRFTTTHIYICTATDTWKRVAISTW